MAKNNQRGRKEYKNRNTFKKTKAEINKLEHNSTEICADITQEPIN